MYDFSLDARREWKSKAAVAEDMSYSFADLLYGLLVEKQPTHAANVPQLEDHCAAKDNRDWGRQKWSGPILLSGDMAQSPTLLMALVLFQQRMQREGLPLDVVCTVYRSGTVAPRIDGRNGFVFKVLTRLVDSESEATGTRRQRGQMRRQERADSRGREGKGRGPNSDLEEAPIES